MSNVLELHQNRSNEQVAKELRVLAERVERGEFDDVSHGIVIFQSKVGQSVSRSILGEIQPYSAQMGLLQYVSHMLYEETRL